jgi:hypothetical protein
MRSIARLGAVAGIAGSDLKKLQIPVPSLGVQRETIAAIESAQEAAEKLRIHADATRKLKHAVLNVVLAGPRGVVSVH